VFGEGLIARRSDPLDNGQSVIVVEVWLICTCSEHQHDIWLPVDD
jgi:hypothetical protein